MNNNVVIAVSIFVALILQSTLIALPLLLYLFLVFYVIKQNIFVIICALISGLVYDALSFHILGASSIFILISFLVCIQYSRKFEIRSIYFILFSATIYGFIYLVLFGYTFIFLQTLIGAFIAVLMYLILEQILAQGSIKEKPYPSSLLS